MSASPAGPTFTSAQTVTITASAADNKGVTRVEFYDGATLIATDTTAPYSVAWSVGSATTGTHAWTAKAYDAANNVATSAALSLTASIDTAAPTVAVSASPAGPTFTSAQTVTITASAADNKGVTRVEFYDGATLIATDTTAPYSVAWSVGSATTGTHAWTAKAYDAANNVTTSAALSLTASIDTAAPTVAVSASPAGPTFTSAQTVTITASAADNKGVTRVEFYDGATLIATDTTAPYSVAWSVGSATTGSHAWTAKAYDAANNVTTSAALSLTASIDTAAPTVAVSASPAGPTFTSAQTVTITASAADNKRRDTGRVLRRRHADRHRHHRALQRRLVGRQRHHRYATPGPPRPTTRPTMSPPPPP